MLRAIPRWLAELSKGLPKGRAKSRGKDNFDFDHPVFLASEVQEGDVTIGVMGGYKYAIQKVLGKPWQLEYLIWGPGGKQLERGRPVTTTEWARHEINRRIHKWIQSDSDDATGSG